MTSVRVTAAGVVIATSLACFAAPVSACDDRYAKKCENAAEAAAAGGQAESAQAAYRAHVRLVTATGGKRTRAVTRQPCAWICRQARPRIALASDSSALGDAGAGIDGRAAFPRLHRSAADLRQCLRGAAQAASGRAEHGGGCRAAASSDCRAGPLRSCRKSRRQHREPCDSRKQDRVAPVAGAEPGTHRHPASRAHRCALPPSRWRRPRRSPRRFWPRASSLRGASSDAAGGPDRSAARKAGR